MNPRLDLLHPYPFERLRRLHAGLAPNPDLEPINCGIGEPQHATPKLITDALQANLGQLGKYPATGGTPDLRTAISNWIQSRYGIPAPSAESQVLPVAGTREALFAFAQAVLDPNRPGAVAMPNPFYQIYEGAAIMAGARPVYVPTPAPSFRPDWGAIGPNEWDQIRLVYVCTPGNPAGAVLGLADWKEFFELQSRYGFVIASDECYSEIYNEEPPIGVLEAAFRLGRSQENLVAFNSLSKRSSAPGLRSGFVAGDSKLIGKFLLYRTYHGAAPSGVVQAASVPAWKDETHVEENRAKYRKKFEMAKLILPEESIPAGGFFLWMPVDDDEAFSRRALSEQSLTVLPGRYLARESNGFDPGKGFVRVALVAEPDVCEIALKRLAELN